MLRSALLLALALSGTAGESDPLAAALTRMRDPDAVVREAAALALGRAGDARAVPLLAEQIVNHIGMGNREAVTILGWLGAAALPALKDLLAHADPFCRTEALRAAQDLGPVAAPLAADIAARLADENRYVRRHALIALRRIGPAAAPHVAAIGKHLGDWLNGPHAARAIAASADVAAVRATLGGPQAALMLSALSEEPAAAPQVLDAILPHLDDATRRAAALGALGAAGTKAAAHVARVVALITDEPDAAAAALARIGTPADALPALIAVATSGGERPNWRTAVIDAAAACPGDAGRDALASLAQDAKAPGGFRLHAIRALAKRDAARAGDAAARLAADKDTRTVRAALNFIAAGAPALKEFAARKEPEIVLIAATRAGDTAPLAAAVAPLAEVPAKERKTRETLLGVVAEAIRYAPTALPVADALKRVPQPPPRPGAPPPPDEPIEAGLTRAVLAGMARNQPLAQAHAPAIAQLIASRNAGVRLSAAAVAVRHGLAGAEAGAHALAQGLASEHDGERMAAIGAVEALGAAAAKPYLPALERALRADDWRERSTAEQALTRVPGATETTGDES